MTKNKYQILCQKIISGGQTGVDRGALDACLEYNFPCGGSCPKGRLAEDGIISEKYPLAETKEKENNFRTRQNVIDSDATLIISPEKLTGGTMWTKKYSNEFKKPLLILSYEKTQSSHFINNLLSWLIQNRISILNVAGPRKSE